MNASMLIEMVGYLGSNSYPTALMNLFLVAINVYNLIKLSKKEQNYDLVEMKSNDGLLGYILDYYRTDIEKFFPGFSKENPETDRAYMVCLNGDPAGVMLGKEREEGVVDVTLDYSVPAYRDCSVGAYLYSKLPAKGIRTLVYSEEESKAHGTYLEKMGFVRENGAYVKKLG